MIRSSTVVQQGARPVCGEPGYEPGELRYRPRYGLANRVRSRRGSRVFTATSTGQLTLHKLRLKKGALDKFRLPVDVVEGPLSVLF